MAVGRERAESAQEGLLRGVLGQRRVPGDAAGSRERGRSGEARERGKSVLIPTAGALDQSRLVGSFGGSRARHRDDRVASRRIADQEPLPRKASKDFTAESALLPIRSRNFWIFARCASDRIGWTSERILAKSTAPSA